MKLSEMRAIAEFMRRAENDGRLGAVHISLYVAILFCWSRQRGVGPVEVTGRELMPLAKVGQKPIYRYLRELHEFGYIVYQPSMSPKGMTRIYLPLLETLSFLLRE